jgi:hypothetical protein
MSTNSPPQRSTPIGAFLLFAVACGLRSRLSLLTRSIANSDAQPDGSSRSTAGNVKCTIADRREPAAHVADQRGAIARVTIRRTTISIELTDAIAAESRDRTLILRWTAPSPTRRREIIPAEGAQTPSIRPMRVKARVGLIEALRSARRWLDELLADPDLRPYARGSRISC